MNLIVGFGYDNAQLKELRHPTRSDLDAVSKDIPILIIHQSGHLGAANSAALALSGIDASTANPPGGVIRRDESGEPNGVLEEYAFFNVLMKSLASIGEDGMLQVHPRRQSSLGQLRLYNGAGWPLLSGSR